MKQRWVRALQAATNICTSPLQLQLSFYYSQCCSTLHKDTAVTYAYCKTRVYLLSLQHSAPDKCASPTPSVQVPATQTHTRTYYNHQAGDINHIHKAHSFPEKIQYSIHEAPCYLAFPSVSALTVAEKLFLCISELAISENVRNTTSIQTLLKITLLNRCKKAAFKRDNLKRF